MDYYNSLLQEIDKARLTGSSSITGLLLAKGLYEKQVLTPAEQVELNTSQLEFELT